MVPKYNKEVSANILSSSLMVVGNSELQFKQINYYFKSFAKIILQKESNLKLSKWSFAYKPKQDGKFESYFIQLKQLWIHYLFNTKITFLYMSKHWIPFYESKDLKPSCNNFFLVSKEICSQTLSQCNVTSFLFKHFFINCCL